MIKLSEDKIQDAKRVRSTSNITRIRKRDTRRENVFILIVCEGEKTEPNYFKAMIDKKHSKVIDVDIEGEGRGTVSLIRKTMEIRDASYKEYDRVWAVFDRDSFYDFNEAIALAEENNINCAWSNESFELWYCLHFINLKASISRWDYISILHREIRKRTKSKRFRYKKNDAQMYYLLQEIGDEGNAIKRAKKLEERYNDKDYHNHNPRTKVYKLVEELNDLEKLLYS